MRAFRRVMLVAFARRSGALLRTAAGLDNAARLLDLTVGSMTSGQTGTLYSRNGEGFGLGFSNVAAKFPMLVYQALVEPR